MKTKISFYSNIFLNTLFAFIFIYGCSYCFGYEWSKTFGGTESEHGRSVQQTTDGGFIIAARTSEPLGLEPADTYLIKTDALGNEVWSKTFDLDFYDLGYSVQQTTDASYIIAGCVCSEYAWENCDADLIKTDALGNEVWSKTFGGAESDQGYSVQQTADGGYIIAGEKSLNHDDSDVYLIYYKPEPVCPHPVGHLDYCRDCGPCAEGEGDCDNQRQCESGLICEEIPGVDTCQSVVCTLPVGHLDYCRDCGACAEGEGDCDKDGECLSGLICAQVTGVDTCQTSSPICHHPVGHLDYCRDCGPCAEGEGDCDDDGECLSGLTCAQVPGVDKCQTAACPHPLGHLDYCRDCGPCVAGQGDCDNDSECQSGLSCVQVLGTDVCCPHPLGHLDYCRDCGPCAEGQGDCDNDSECQSGLTCAQVPGADTCQ
jgi:hypothetical protein